MESNRRIGLILIISCLSIGSILLIPVEGFRDGYIMNLILGALHDVILTNPTSGQVLTYNGSYWINDNGDNSFVEIERKSPSDGDSAFTTDTFIVRKYLDIILYAKGNENATSADIAIRFNSDSGNNYDYRHSVNGGADASASNTNRCLVHQSFDDDHYLTATIEITNIANTEKLYKSNSIRASTSDGSIPSSDITYCTWRNTTDAITTITVTRIGGTWTFDDTTEIIIYGAN